MSEHLQQVSRRGEGTAIHDGAVYPLTGCPRQRTDCAPLARRASEDYVSFMCCGETHAAPVPTDTLRLCVKSTHDHGVDVLINIDARDAIDTIAVLAGGLSWVAVEQPIRGCGWAGTEAGVVPSPVGAESFTQERKG